MHELASAWPKPHSRQPWNRSRTKCTPAKRDQADIFPGSRINVLQARSSQPAHSLPCSYAATCVTSLNWMNAQQPSEIFRAFMPHTHEFPAQPPPLESQAGATTPRSKQTYKTNTNNATYKTPKHKTQATPPHMHLAGEAVAMPSQHARLSANQSRNSRFAQAQGKKKTAEQ